MERVAVAISKIPAKNSATTASHEFFPTARNFHRKTARTLRCRRAGRVADGESGLLHGFFPQQRKRIELACSNPCYSVECSSAKEPTAACTAFHRAAQSSAARWHATRACCWSTLLASRVCIVTGELVAALMGSVATVPGGIVVFLGAECQHCAHKF